VAGKDQHHIWRMLQRGFSFTDKGPDQIWVYSKASEPRQWVTKKFGQDEYFYGQPDVGADKNITDYENSVQGFIQEARLTETGYQIDRETCAALLSHLEMRSQFIRDEMSRMGERAVQFLRNQLSSKSNFPRLVGAYLRKHPEVLESQLKEAGIDSSLWPAISGLVAQGIPNEVENTRLEIRTLFAGLFDSVVDSLVDIAKKSHNESMMSDFTEIERTNMHRRLDYFVYRTSSRELILPDTCVAFFMEGGCRPVSSRSDRIEGVVIPISADAAIVGKSTTHFNRDVSTIKRALASCAYKEFLSPLNNPELRNLSSRISKNAKLISDTEMQKIFRIDTLLDSL
jgi:hypothetical protein